MQGRPGEAVRAGWRLVSFYDHCVEGGVAAGSQFLHLQMCKAAFERWDEAIAAMSWSGLLRVCKRARARQRAGQREYAAALLRHWHSDTRRHSRSVSHASHVGYRRFIARCSLASADRSRRSSADTIRRKRWIRRWRHAIVQRRRSAVSIDLARLFLDPAKLARLEEESMSRAWALWRARHALAVERRQAEASVMNNAIFEALYVPLLPRDECREFVEGCRLRQRRVFRHWSRRVFLATCGIDQWFGVYPLFIRWRRFSAWRDRRREGRAARRHRVLIARALRTWARSVAARRHLLGPVQAGSRRGRLVRLTRSFQLFKRRVMLCMARSWPLVSENALPTSDGPHFWARLQVVHLRWIARVRDALVNWHAFTVAATAKQQNSAALQQYERVTRRSYTRWLAFRRDARQECKLMASAVRAWMRREEASCLRRLGLRAGERTHARRLVRRAVSHWCTSGSAWAFGRLADRAARRTWLASLSRDATQRRLHSSFARWQTCGYETRREYELMTLAVRTWRHHEQASCLRRLRWYVSSHMRLAGVGRRWSGSMAALSFNSWSASASERRMTRMLLSRVQARAASSKLSHCVTGWRRKAKARRTVEMSFRRMMERCLLGALRSWDRCAGARSHTRRLIRRALSYWRVSGFEWAFGRLADRAARRTWLASLSRDATQRRLHSSFARWQTCGYETRREYELMTLAVRTWRHHEQASCLRRLRWYVSSHMRLAGVGRRWSGSMMALSFNSWSASASERSATRLIISRASAWAAARMLSGPARRWRQKAAAYRKVEMSFRRLTRRFLLGALHSWDRCAGARSHTRRLIRRALSYWRVSGFEWAFGRLADCAARRTWLASLSRDAIKRRLHSSFARWQTCGYGTRREFELMLVAVRAWRHHEQASCLRRLRWYVSSQRGRTRIAHRFSGSIIVRCFSTWRTMADKWRLVYSCVYRGQATALLALMSRHWQRWRHASLLRGRAQTQVRRMECRELVSALQWWQHTARTLRLQLGLRKRSASHWTATGELWAFAQLQANAGRRARARIFSRGQLVRSTLQGAFVRWSTRSLESLAVDVAIRSWIYRELRVALARLHLHTILYARLLRLCMRWTGSQTANCFDAWCSRARLLARLRTLAGTVRARYRRSTLEHPWERWRGATATMRTISLCLRKMAHGYLFGALRLWMRSAQASSYTNGLLIRSTSHFARRAEVLSLASLRSHARSRRRIKSLSTLARRALMQRVVVIWVRGGFGSKDARLAALAAARRLRLLASAWCFERWLAEAGRLVHMTWATSRLLQRTFARALDTWREAAARASGSRAVAATSRAHVLLSRIRPAFHTWHSVTASIMRFRPYLMAWRQSSSWRALRMWRVVCADRIAAIVLLARALDVWKAFGLVEALKALRAYAAGCMERRRLVYRAARQWIQWEVQRVFYHWARAAEADAGARLSARRAARQGVLRSVGQAFCHWGVQSQPEDAFAVLAWDARRRGDWHARRTSLRRAFFTWAWPDDVNVDDAQAAEMLNWRVLASCDWNAGERAVDKRFFLATVLQRWKGGSVPVGLALAALRASVGGVVRR